jgi:hypothetical protein
MRIIRNNGCLAIAGYNGAIMTGTSILERIIKPNKGSFSNEHARYVLSLDFSAREEARYAKLANKAQDGVLTEKEEAELNEFVTANAILTILQSKARMSLKKRNPAA